MAYKYFTTKDEEESIRQKMIFCIVMAILCFTCSTIHLIRCWSTPITGRILCPIIVAAICGLIYVAVALAYSLKGYINTRYNMLYEKINEDVSKVNDRVDKHLTIEGLHNNLS